MAPDILLEVLAAAVAEDTGRDWVGVYGDRADKPVL
jgi:hypothetical protein